MLTKVDKVEVTTATSFEKIIENIQINNTFYRENVFNAMEWRETKPIAIVGGGPSLRNTLKELKNFDKIIVCGSAHDYLIQSGIIPDYAVIVDPDPLVLGYLKEKRDYITYIVASQCDPAVFGYFNKNRVLIFHAGGDGFDPKHFGEGEYALGGGCTVGTRALAVALGMGYNNIHLFGFDTCLNTKLEHHAYELNDPEKETLGTIQEISLDGPEGKKFMVAGYMMAQFFDFQKMIGMFYHRMQITVHGEGLLKELIDLAKQKSSETPVT